MSVRSTACFITGRMSACTLHMFGECPCAKASASALGDPSLSSELLGSMDRDALLRHAVSPNGRLRLTPSDALLTDRQNHCRKCLNSLAKREADGRRLMTVDDLLASRGLADRIQGLAPFVPVSSEKRSQGLAARETRLRSHEEFLRAMSDPARFTARLLMNKDFHIDVHRAPVPRAGDLLNVRGPMAVAMPDRAPWDAASVARAAAFVCLLHATSVNYDDEFRREAAEALLAFVRSEALAGADETQDVRLERVREAALPVMARARSLEGWTAMLRLPSARALAAAFGAALAGEREAARLMNERLEGVRQETLELQLRRREEPRRREPPGDGYDVHYTHINMLMNKALSALAEDDVSEDADGYKEWFCESLKRAVVRLAGTHEGRESRSVFCHYLKMLDKDEHRSERDVFERVANRIRRLHSGNDDAMDILVSRVRDMFMKDAPSGRFSLACPHGRITRLLGVFDGLESDWAVGLSQGQVREYIGTFAAHVSRRGGTREEYLAKAREEFDKHFLDQWQHVVDEFALGFE